jgi:hypothetical protein
MFCFSSKFIHLYIDVMCIFLIDLKYIYNLIAIGILIDKWRCLFSCRFSG